MEKKSYPFKIMKRFFCIISLFALSLLVGQGIYFLREGFNPRRLQRYDLTNTTSLSPEIKQVLSQRFFYLGRGRQSFAFASEDGKYVLKFPRTDIYKIPFWTRALPLTSYRKRAKAEKKRRQQFVFESFRIAIEELKEETGIIAVHLGKSEPSDEQLHLIDVLGFHYHFPVQTTHFILQHRKQLWTPLFLEAVKNNDRPEKERLLNAFVDVVIQRAKKGVLNKDRSFLRNYGFDGEKAYQIDVGDFFHTNQSDWRYLTEKCAHDTMSPVQEWLATIDPEMLPLVKARLDQL